MSLIDKPSHPLLLAVARSKKNPILAISLFLLVPLLAPVWLPRIGEFLVVSDGLQKADALVLLGGDEEERIRAGARLFQQGYADWLIVTDMRLELPNSAGVYSENVKRKAVAQGVPAGRILIVPEQVSTTYEEAVRLREFALSEGFHSLIVVTSPYHTRRARWLLRGVFQGSGVSLIVRPAREYNYPAKTWWRNTVNRRETILEYAKFLGQVLGCREYGDCGPLPWAWMKRWSKSTPGESFLTIHGQPPF